MKSLMDIMKSSMTSLYESLLDDEEEVLNRSYINIFDNLCSSTNRKDFYKNMEILFDMCTKVNSIEEMKKHKNSFFIATVNNSFSGNLAGIVIDKALVKSKKAVRIGIYTGVDEIFLYISKFGKICFGQGHRISGYDQYEHIYVLPPELEKQWIEYLKNNESRIKTEYGFGKAYKNKIDKIV